MVSNEKCAITIANIEDLVKNMCDLAKEGSYAPILEADVAGFLYHLMIKQGICPINKIHLDTRIIGSQDNNERFDLVIGNIEQQNDKRPAISPEAVIEIKMFPNGFTSQAHRIHFDHILKDDLRKLGNISNTQSETVEFIFDEFNYLGGNYDGQNRKEVIINTRNKISPKTYLIFAIKIKGE